MEAKYLETEEGKVILNKTLTFICKSTSSEKRGPMYL